MLFVDDVDKYDNDVDPYNQAREQLVTFIEKTYDINGEEANAVYKEMLKDRDVKNPQVTFVERENSLDRRDAAVGLLEYIEHHKTNNESMTPAFTCYDRKEPSYQGLFIQDGLSKRSDKKKEAAICEGKGDKLGFLINNLLQKAFKLRNNSLSGAYLSMSTIFYNPASHTALASTTRMAASLANMVTESMVAGRRLYKDPESVINHFLSLLTEMDRDKVITTNLKYDIKDPTVEEVMGMVKHSITDYWDNPKYLSSIESFVSKLKPEERSIILFTYDLFHMEKVNTKFTRNMLVSLSKPHMSLSDDVEVLKDYDEFTINIAHHIVFNKIKGLGTDYKSYPRAIRDNLISTVIGLNDALEHFKDYIDTYLKSKTMPINISYIKEMVMEAVSHSDTDSTCGWYGHRVEDKFGRYDMSEKGIGYFSIYMMFNSGVVSHLLRQLTTNLNVATENRDKLAMKNEYFFPVFASANSTKHYISNIMMKEGLVYEEPKLEIKGNTLISSNNDQYIRDDFTNLVSHITTILSTGEQLDVEDILGRVAGLERNILDRLYKGDASVFKMDKINNTYKAMKNDPSKWVSTNIYHSRLYDAVFEEKYGKSHLLPFIAVSIPIKKGKLLDMIEEIEDVSIKDKFKEFVIKHPKNDIGRLLYPLTVIKARGLPVELEHMVDSHTLILRLLKGHYVLLEILGIYIKEGCILTDQGY